MKKYMPAVKMSVFTFCDQFKVGPAVIESIKVVVVYYHPRRRSGYESVQSDYVVFAVDPFAESCISVVA